MKKLIIALLVIVSFSSCHLFEETHTFTLRENIAGTIVTSTKVVTAVGFYHVGQLVYIDGKVWECQK